MPFPHRHRHRHRKDSAITRSKSTPDFALRGNSTMLTYEEIQVAMNQGPEAMEVLLQMSEKKGLESRLDSDSKALQLLEECRERQWEEAMKQDRDRVIFFYVREYALEEALAAATDPEDQKVIAQELRYHINARDFFLAKPRVCDYTKETLVGCAIAGRDHIVRTPEYQNVIESQTWRGVTDTLVFDWLKALYQAVAELDFADKLAESMQNPVVNDGMNEAVDVGKADFEERSMHMD